MLSRLIVLVSLVASGSVMATEGYYQSPSIRGEKVVFTAEGDLWLHLLGSGQAKRLTTHPSLETSAAISPDGSKVAFVSDYHGVAEAYVMPLSGGVPKRVTYENAGVIVHGWTAQNELLVSAATRKGAPSNMALKIVNVSNLEVRPIPLADAFDGAVDSAGEMVYFTQFGLQWSTDNANVYRGGMRGLLWRFELGDAEEASRMLPDHAGNARRPMIDGERLYFVSDASGRDNLWSVATDGSDLTQLTAHDDFSVRGASLDEGRIVYQLGADLYLFNVNTSVSEKLAISLTSDHPGLREKWVNNPMEYVTSATMSGNGEKVAVTARGRIALATTDESRLVTVGTSQSHRMRNAALSRDGKWVYAVSDRSGEAEIWRYDSLGGSEAQQLTENSDALRGQFAESPDGKWLAYDDGKGGLWLLDVESRKNQLLIGNAEPGHQYSDIAWSPDSERLAVSHLGREDSRQRILLYELETERQAFLTSGKYESSGPAFSPDGTWLYYLSNRHFATTDSVWRDRDFGPSFDNRGLVFATALTADAEFPFEIPTELNKAAAADDDDEEETEATVEIAWDGLAARVRQVPVAPADYWALAVGEEYLYLAKTANGSSELEAVALEPYAEAAAFTDSVSAVQLSDDRSTMMVAKESGDEMTFYLIPAAAEFPADPSENTLQTTGWQFSVDPQAEWRQIFNDTWLMHREQFFDPEMRGEDWAMIREKYAPLADRATDRRELNDVLAQMIAELNALHSQVRGGDFPEDPDAPSPAVLGAELKQANNGVEISYIYRHEVELPGEAPPLARPGVDASAGDVIVAINGKATPTLESLHLALRNQAGKQVLLSMERGRNTVQTVVVPDALYKDFSYSYRDWIIGNRKKVAAADDRIGYLHIEAMGSGDVSAFAREFYASDNKHGMVIDVRRNNGGNVDSWIIDRLMRKAWMFWSYHGGEPGFNLQNTFRGHLVVIADEGTYSDGETFTAAIKKLGIAPVIGKRTAGAGVWLSGRNRVSDSGIARVAEFPVYDLQGHWIVEGYGVSPTMEVDNLPHATYKGGDAQLDAAIRYLQQKLQEEPLPEVSPRPFPPNGTPAKDAVAE